MDPLVVFRRTEAGDALAKRPRDIKVIEWRAVLLLVDGVLPVREMQQRFGSALNVASVLEAMQAEGLVEPAPLEVPLSEDLPEPVDPDWFSVAPRAEPRDAEPEPAAPPPEPEAKLPPPPRRRHGPSSRTVVKLAAAVVVLAGVVSAFMLPSMVRPDAEAALSAALQQPVTIRDASLSLTHGPGVALKGVLIGAAPGLAVPEILLQPDFVHLIDSRALQARLPSLTATPSQLAALAAAAPRLERLSRVQFDALTVATTPFPALHGSLELTTKGNPGYRLQDHEGTVSIEAQGNQEGLDFELFAPQWQLPLFDGMSTEGLQASGRLASNILDIRHFTLAAYQGRIEGDVRFLLESSRVQADGTLHLFGLDVAAILQKLDNRARTRGAASGELRFSMSGAGFDSMRLVGLNGPLKIERGALAGIDIPMALRERAASPSAGGETPFESLDGELTYDTNSTRFALRHLNAFALSGNGELRLDHNTPPKLSGRLQLQVSGSDRGVYAPAFLDGELGYPRIQIGAVSVRPD